MWTEGPQNGPAGCESSIAPRALPLLAPTPRGGAVHVASPALESSLDALEMLECHFCCISCRLPLSVSLYLVCLTRV